VNVKFVGGWREVVGKKKRAWQHQSNSKVVSDAEQVIAFH